MKQTPIVIVIDHNIRNIFPMPAHNYMDKSNILGKSSSLIFHSGGVATILWSDDSKKLKTQVIRIDIVMKFNSFIQKDCE